MATITEARDLVLVKADPDDHGAVYYRNIRFGSTYLGEQVECGGCGWVLEHGNRAVETYTEDTDDREYNGIYCSRHCAMSIYR